jgi:hypothetical protein
MTRRGVMKGVGGLAALSMTGATVAQAQEVISNPLPADPHTRETYRSIVDAIIPRTPELESELGPEHVPGGLDVELEKFLIWDFNHFQEVRLETLTAAQESQGLPGLADPDESGGGLGGLGGLGGGDEGGLGSVTGTVDDVTGTVTGDGPVGLMPVDLFEFGFDGGSDTADLDALVGSLDLGLGELDSLLEAPLDAVREILSFGDVQSFELSMVEDLEPGVEGPASFEMVADLGSEVISETYGDYPYGVVFPFAFDLVAAEFIAMGKNEDTPQPRPEFAGGGTFTTLSREDRLRCLWTIVDTGVIDRLDSALSPMLPAVGILKYVVMAVNGLHGFGYYTEWSGLGSTKTAEPADRQMEIDESQVQSRQQTGYPGPANGYAADWRHALEKVGMDKFDDAGYDIDSDTDPFDTSGYDPSGDLVGDDIVEGTGGDA